MERTGVVSAKVLRHWVRRNMQPLIWLETLLVGSFFLKQPWPQIGPCVAVAITALVAILLDGSSRGKLRIAVTGAATIVILLWLMVRDRATSLQNDHLVLLAMIALAGLVYSLIGDLTRGMTGD